MNKCSQRFIQVINNAQKCDLSCNSNFYTCSSSLQVLEAMSKFIKLQEIFVNITLKLENTQRIED
jgi:hypothetical protein